MHLCGANLFACKKKGGSHRPIAVREVLRRLVSKCLSRSVHADVLRILTPLQVGVAVKVGCEAVVHAVTQVLEDRRIPPDSRCTLPMDFVNAFNSVDRGHMFHELRARLPGLSSWVECCSESQPLLHFEDHIILKRCGVLQGDPLGLLLFALTLHAIVQKIHQEVPNLRINAWYLEDGTLYGYLDNLQLALRIVEEDGPERRLKLNRSRSLLFIPKDADADCNPLPCEIPISKTGFFLLGAPIGRAELCNASTMKRLDKITQQCPDFMTLKTLRWRSLLFTPV